MKIASFLFLMALISLSGCCAATKNAYQDSYELWLTDGSVSMKTLQKMDSGDIHQAKTILMTSLFMTLDGLSYYAAQAHPTEQQKYEETKLAKEVLDFMLTHRDDFDPRLPSVQAGMRGLRKILTGSGDVRRLNELSDYMEKQKP